MSVSRDLNKRLRGRRIENIRLRPFSDGKGERAYDPEIILDNGSAIRFVVQETESGEYGVALVVADYGPQEAPALGLRFFRDPDDPGAIYFHLDKAFALWNVINLDTFPPIVGAFVAERVPTDRLIPCQSPADIPESAKEPLSEFLGGQPWAMIIESGPYKTIPAPAQDGDDPGVSLDDAILEVLAESPDGFFDVGNIK